MQQDITFDNTELFGIECDLLGITSPYSYIASSPVYAYEIPFETMFKTLLDLNPAGLICLKKQAADKIQRFAALCRGKERRLQGCQKTLEPVKGDQKRE